MRYLGVFILWLLCQTVWGQAIRGVCVDATGNPVEYVNIGVRGSYVGGLSDGKGVFAIEVPDSLAEDSLTFSHISYRPRTVAVKALRGGAQTIVLEGREFHVAPVEVRQWKSKLRMLHNMGIRYPMAAAEVHRDSSDSVRQPDKEIPLISVVIDLTQDTWIKQVELDILKNTFVDLVRLRIVVYRVEGENKNLEPLMARPYYVDIPVSQERQKLVCDLSDQYIVARGRVYVGYEVVTKGRVGQMKLPLYLGGGKTHFRYITGGVNETLPVNPGIRVRGVVKEGAK